MYFQFFQNLCCYFSFQDYGAMREASKEGLPYDQIEGVKEERVRQKEVQNEQSVRDMIREHALATSGGGLS